jgi:hypothetical protein
MGVEGRADCNDLGGAVEGRAQSSGLGRQDRSAGPSVERCMPIGTNEGTAACAIQAEKASCSECLRRKTGLL